MYNNQIKTEFNLDSDIPMNFSIMNMLTNDMNEVLNKNILQYLVSLYSKKEATPNPLSPALRPSINLNHFSLRQRKNMYTPVARYVNTECSSPNQEKDQGIDSINASKDEIIPSLAAIFNRPESHSSNEKSPSHQYLRRLKPIKKTREEIRKLKMDLAFENETGEFATRCDVVYKTILRDFRRFFLDDYKLYKTKCLSKSNLTESLHNFTVQTFPMKSMRDCQEISLDLGCLLFPKEMIKDSKAIEQIIEFGYFGNELEEVKKEIMKIQGFLYKFSIDKIEECFQNISLCELFLAYVFKSQNKRIVSNPTMKKNSKIYIKARKILEKRASESLCL